MQNNEKPVLLLCETENSGQLDRRALREAGYGSVQVMTSGIDAAKMLAAIDRAQEESGPEIVVCSHRLADMDGDQFCAIVRQHPLLLALPILLIAPNENEAEQLRTLGCGASSLLGRPYRIDELKKHLDSLSQSTLNMAKLRHGARQMDTSAFDAALATYGILLRPSRQPEDYFKVGMTCLEEKRWNNAISAFQLALANAQIKAEAELGMAAAFKGKGDMRRFQAWLGRAAETLVMAKRWHFARTAYAKLLQHDPDAKNPFLTRAHQLIRAREYDEAAHTLVESLSVMRGARTGDHFARLCFTAPDPNAMLHALEQSLSSEGGSRADNLSAEIRQSLTILAKERQQKQRELAAERKWQLARKLEEQKKSMQDQPQPGSVPQERTETLSVPEIGLEQTEDEFLAEEDESMQADDTPEAGPVLAPLQMKDATSDIFAQKPKLNEFLSVVKFTWKLARKSKKEK